MRLSQTRIRGVTASRLSVLAALMISAPAMAVSQDMSQGATPTSSCGATTTVQPGDTYTVIAQRCDVTVDQIARANPGVDHTRLQIGQTLRLDGRANGPRQDEPPQASQPPETEPGPQTDLGVLLGLSVKELMDDPDPEAFARGLAQQFLDPQQPEPEEPEERVQISGVLTEEGVECPTMRGHDGQLYSLIGSLDGRQAGDVVQVQGTTPDFSFCQRGITIEVEDISGH